MFIKFAQAIIEQWQNAKDEHDKGKAGKYVTCSIGFHLEQVSKTSDKTTMVKNADKALYLAKEQGRNCFVQSNIIAES
ncbi:diguanylate cyclase [Thalassotalea sp. SU-HH00458]|uniref:diguanylate cyclase domain-containing protein n=1 Tax=Thalassotalea sp. SU-HH00458 TaxID=3127657 RepID=UPI003365AF6C